MTGDYKRMFIAGTNTNAKQFPYERRHGDAADEATSSKPVYIYDVDNRIEIAVNVALATGRPLLLEGPSGCGKSSLARNVASTLKWRYHEIVVTSQTQSQDMQWWFDAVSRFGDAQAKAADTHKEAQGGEYKYLQPRRYIVPRPLWWAFDRDSAKTRGHAAGNLEECKEPGEQPDCDECVVLIDEIDKADPDVPNNLLVPLGSLRFTVTEQGEEIRVTAKKAPLVFITSNKERELPMAFLRRCVRLDLKAPDADRLIKIGEAHFPKSYKKQKTLFERIAEVIIKRAEERASESGMLNDVPEGPSTAEYLDAVAACLTTGADPQQEDGIWEQVYEVIFDKNNRQTL